MNRVLITGKGSYIGSKVEEWLKRAGHEVDVLDMMGDTWKKHNFRGYDSVYHVAGIAHRKDVPVELYEQVNHILAVDVAKRAAEAGVKQFVFMSSGAVYAQSDRKHPTLIVNEDSKLEPSTQYGITKLKAEMGIREFAERMKIAILRPPMVYGPHAKGNYNLLSKAARLSPIFPEINNTRSMIYIDNLCEFIRLIIENNSEGVFLPQNAEYVSTTNIVKEIARIHNKKILFCKGFNWIIALCGLFNDSVNKVFGDYYYKPQNPYFENKYQVVSFVDSIEKTEHIN